MCRVLEPFRKLDAVSSRWNPSKDRFMKIYWKRQKASLWQEAVGNTQTGTQAQRNRGHCPVGQWEYVSAYYSLWFQVSTFLGFIMWRMCCCRVGEVRSATHIEGLFISRLQSAQTPEEREGEDKRYVLSNFVPASLLSLSVDTACFCFRNAGRMDTPISSTGLHIRGK